MKSKIHPWSAIITFLQVFCNYVFCHPTLFSSCYMSPCSRPMLSVCQFTSYVCLFSSYVVCLFSSCDVCLLVPCVVCLFLSCVVYFTVLLLCCCEKVSERQNHSFLGAHGKRGEGEMLCCCQKSHWLRLLWAACMEINNNVTDLCIFLDFPLMIWITQDFLLVIF